MEKRETIVFIGRSGSGKGTQITLLKDYLKQQSPDVDILHYESGAHFRSFIKRQGYTSELMREVIARGDLAPDFITEWLLVDEFVKYLTDSKTLIIDGFPRTISQALTLHSAMKFYKRGMVKVIHLKVSADAVKERLLSRGRSDDSELEVIERRIAWYNKNTVPVLEYLSRQDQYQIIEIDGDRPVEEIHHDIINAISDNIRI
jgi:adenylate kinase